MRKENEMSHKFFRRFTDRFLLLGIIFVLIACTVAPATPTPTLLPPTPTPQGRTLLVTSNEDSGPGTLRQALLNAKPYDVITFDPAVFPPVAPVTIALSSGLPELNQGNITIEASNAGVILDGNNVTIQEFVNGISISSDNNIIRGLQIVGFSGAGIGLNGGAQYNLIGGEQNVGVRVWVGQGNLISGNHFGVGLWDETTSHNMIKGNFIGSNLDWTATWGNAQDGIHSNGATQNLITGNVIVGNENAGVYLCCALNGLNVVTNNLIGTVPLGVPLGNGLAGIIIDRSRYNVVGPGNTIAHNLGDGISFWEDTPYNTVTKNSIYANSGRGIGISDTQGILQPPLIFNWDLQAGTVAGSACANCTVEIFSIFADQGDQGAFYEGQATADSTGFFYVDRGSFFRLLRLTATATDPAGNTSEFSPPTQGNRRSLNLQVGNLLPMFPLQNKPSNELADNRIGDVAAVEHISERVWNTGYKWMHLIVDYEGQWQYIDWEREEYALDPREEQVVEDLRSQGVKIQLVLDVWEWQNRVVDYRSEEGIQKYLNWVRYLVRHFKGRIEYYEILNEPEPTVTSLGITADDYINLVKRTVPIIREEDSRAKIVVGSIPDTRFDHVRDFMWDLLKSDVMPLVDGISWHPMFGAFR